MASLAGPLVFGAGLRHMGTGDLPTGIEAFGQVPLSPMFRLEGGFGLRVLPVSTTTAASILDIAYQGDPNTKFQFPLSNDAFTVGATADFTPVPVLRNKGLTGALHLRAGLELAAVEMDIATVSESYRAGESPDPVQRETQPSVHFEFGPTVGVAIDAFVGKRFGVRWRGGTRLSLREEGDFIVGDIDPSTGQQQILDDEITATTTWSLDFVVAL